MPHRASQPNQIGVKDVKVHFLLLYCSVGPFGVGGWCMVLSTPGCTDCIVKVCSCISYLVMSRCVVVCSIMSVWLCLSLTWPKAADWASKQF